MYQSFPTNLSAIHVTVNANVFVITNQQTSWVASLSLLGALFGSIFGGIAMKFGRRNVLRAATLPFSASWIITVFAINVQMIYVTSFVAGFCCAIILMVSQASIRNRISRSFWRNFICKYSKHSTLRPFSDEISPLPFRVSFSRLEIRLSLTSISFFLFSYLFFVLREVYL